MAVAAKHSSDVRFRLTKTQLAYALCTDIVTILYGPMGSGKSYAHAATVAAHARRNKEQRGIREVRGCIIRDNLPNIRRSPIPTLKKAFGRLIQFRDEDRQATIHIDPIVIIDCFGIQDLGDLSKLQGPEYAFIWLVEPAPIADTQRYNGGIPEEVFNIALARCARQDEAIPRLMIDMNPADDEHWTYRRLIEVPDGPDPDAPLITKSTFRLPLDENIYLQEVAKQAVRAAYKYDQSSLTRFVEGDFAMVVHGKKVVEGFNRRWHVANDLLQPIRGYEGIRMWDSWGEPRCVLGQQLPNGQLRVLDVIVDHTDITNLIPKVKSAINSPRWQHAQIRNWRDIGDCTMRIHDQSSRFSVTSEKLEEAFGTFFEPGPQKWPQIKSAVASGFRNNTSDGEPCVLICPSQKGLIAGFAGRWHYKTDASGNVMKQTPEKNQSSHACDAVANGIAVLQPWQSPIVNMQALHQLNQKQRKRAAGYGQPHVVVN